MTVYNYYLTTFFVTLFMPEVSWINIEYYFLLSHIYFCESIKTIKF